MSGGKLSVEIGADKTDFDKKIKEVEFDIKELSKVKLDRLKVGLDTSEINAQIKDAKASLNSLKTTVKDTGAQIGNQFTKQVGNGGNTLMQFSRIAQDAPFGIIGIGNNITATAESFSYLKQQTGSTGGALKALAGSIMGTGGILLGVSLLTTGLTLLSQSGLTLSDVINRLTGNTDAYADALKSVNDNAYKDKSVQDAIVNVNALTNEVKLAKEGFLDKDKVVEHYNETIGKTTGLVSSLDEVEQQLVKNGDAYIKMTLYKAAANLALNEAAKKQLEAERIRIKKLAEFTNAFLDADLTQTRSKEQYEQKQKDLAQKQTNRKNAEIKEAENASKINLSIAKKFQEDAARIANDFKFNFFGDNKKVKTFNTPQVSNIKSYLIPAPLFDVAQIALFNGQVDAFGNKIRELPNTIKASVINASLRANEELVKFNAMWAQFGTDFASILETGIESSLIGFGEALGTALINGGNILEQVGASLLNSIGSTVKAIGTELIKMGILAQAYAAVVKWMKKAFTNPYALAAAGVALVVVGAAISASASRVASGGGSGSGVSASSGSGANNSSFTSSGFSSNQGGGTVVFEISGQKLIGVLSNTIGANKRLGGTLGLG